MMKTRTAARTIAALLHIVPLLLVHLPFESAAQTSPVPTEDAAQSEKGSADPAQQRRHWVGSSLFMLANLVPSDEPPSFFQLNYGYRLTPRDTLSLEAITWKYYAPLGIPYGPKMGAEAYTYPGSVRGYGIGLAYQRFFWKGLYAALHVLPLRQIYMDATGSTLQRGFQLFTTLRLGYHFSFFHDRVFIEPSLAITWWPVNTHLPSSFQEREHGFPSFFLAEPGLHYGIKF